MNKKLLVVADLGHFKAYKLEQNQSFSQPRLQLLEQWDTDVPRHLSQELSDQAGQYRKGSVPSGASNLSDGEQHNIDLERRRRALKTVATHMRELLNRKEIDVDGCYFAAGPEINGAILDQLDNQTKSRIQKNVCANLTRLNTEEVVSRFCP
jgi:23S rRNA G2069 N7-methylase RlmK/C1962 C5-methylase RlmI